MTTTCDHCSRRSSSPLCPKCGRTLQVGLRNVAALFADLDTTVRSGAGRYGDGSGGRSKAVHARLPFDSRFVAVRRVDVTDETKHILAAAETRAPLAEVEHEVRNTLSTWSRVCADHWRPLPLLRPLVVCADPGGCERCGRMQLDRVEYDRERARRAQPRDTVTAMCLYLVRLSGHIASERWADELLRDVLHLERRLRRSVDRPADQWYAGVCGAVTEDARPHDATSCGCQCHHGLGIACDVPGGCGLEDATIDAEVCTRALWAKADDREIRCFDCGTTWDVPTRREILLSEARTRVATVDAIWRIVHEHVDDSIGYTQLAARVRQWKHRGKIQPATYRHDPALNETRSAYLVGDVLDLLRKREDEAS